MAHRYSFERTATISRGVMDRSEKDEAWWSEKNRRQMCNLSASSREAVAKTPRRQFAFSSIACLDVLRSENSGLSTSRLRCATYIPGFFDNEQGIKSNWC